MSEYTDTLKEVATIFLAVLLVMTGIAYPIMLPGVAVPELVKTFAMMGAQFLFGAAAGAFAVKNYVKATEAATAAKLAVEEKVE